MKKTKITFREANPEAAKLWVDEMNNGMTPDNTLQHSGKTVYLRCVNDPNHLFQKKVCEIPQEAPYSCPYCRETRPVVQPGKNDFFTVCPESAQMWDWENNKGIDPYQLLPKCRTIINFKCVNGHSFSKSVHNFTRSPKCPECKKKKYAVSNYSYMVRQWDFKKNTDFDINLTSASSSAIVWWKCKKCGYEWQARISSRRASKGLCPCCENRTIITPGITDLFSVVPDIKEDYDFSKNTDIDVGTLSVTSMTSVYWKCHVCGYEWSAYPSSRTIYDNGKYLVRNCPSCSGHIRTKTYAEEYPDLLPRFLVDKNGCILSDLKSKDNPKKFWWHCEMCGEDFKAALGAMIRSRNTASQGCPYCSGKKVKHENSFAYLHPEYMDEYDPDNTIDPYNVTERSPKYVKWICRNNKTHRWEASFQARANGYGGCKICRIYQFEKMFCEEHPEFESYFDTEKNDRPFISYSNMSNESVWWKCSKGHSFKWVVMNFSRDNKFSCPYCDQKWLQPGVNTLADTHPQLALEWSDANDHPPTAYFKRSYENVLWKCPKCKGEYTASIHDREYGDDSCPYCANKRVLAGYNSLADVKPTLIAEWSPSNTESASEVLATSTEYVKWICPTCNGEYNFQICMREAGDDSCPYCSNKLVLAGFNSLADKKPELISEWSPNNKRLPTEFFTTSWERVNWICPACNGEYSTMIRNREVGDDSCPYCNNRRLLDGFNSLEDKKPKLIVEWSPNNEYQPSDYMYTSTYAALWFCPTCHGEYQARICDREVGDDSCPYCKGIKVLPGYNSFQSKHPKMMEEWDAMSNYLICDPDQILDSYANPVWWNCNICKCKYMASPQKKLYYEHRHMQSCPHCKGLRQKKKHFI